MTGKRVAIALLGLMGVAILVVGGAIVWLVTADLRPLIEKYASESLERRVSIGKLRIGWGNPLSLELRDLRVANAAWSSEPDMISIESLSAEIDPWSISSGILRFQKLNAVKPVIVLERNASRLGNWKFNGTSSSSSSGFAVVLKNRTQFPSLIDFVLHDGLVRYRLNDGTWLRIGLGDVTIASPGDNQPVTMTVDGAYNDTPVKLTAETQSFAVLRDKSAPFGTKLTIATAPATIDFDGTMTEPLDFEGVKGPVKVEVRKLGDFLKIFDAGIDPNPAVSIAGDFEKTLDHWQMTNAKGAIAGNAFTGELALSEAGRGQPDEVSETLRFGTLDVNRVIGPANKIAWAKAGNFASFPLRIEASQGNNLETRIDAKQLIAGTARLADFSVHFRLTTAGVTLHQLNFAFAGGRVDSTGSATPAAGGSHVVGQVSLTGADAAQLAQFAGGEPGQFTGRLDGAAAFDMTGDTVGSAAKVGRGTAVLSMNQGQVARDLVEKISTDLRNLFRNGQGSVSVTCLLGVVEMRDGLGRISPLRLRTAEATLIGGGQIDMLRRRLDMTIQSESASTGFFALDIPIHVSGEFAHLSVDPQFGASPKLPQILNTQGLSPGLRSLAERNPCLH